MNDFDIRKVANALIFFIDKKVYSLTKTKFIKMMFFADKLHLEKYGRSIFGDTYRKLPKGPVPTLTYSVIDSVAAESCDNEDVEDLVNGFSEYISVSCKPNKKGFAMTVFDKKSEFNEKIFSKSEIEVLNVIADKYKDFTVNNIIDATHETEEFKKTPMKFSISEEAMSGSNKDYVSFWEKEFHKLNAVIN